VLVANDKEVDHEKVRFTWTGPAMVVAMVGNSVARVRHLFKPKTTKDEVREENVHTSRLAFYSKVWEDKTLEVKRQIMFDMDKFVPERFIELEYSPEGHGYSVLVE